ncbi:MAG: hypothetical protein WC627_00975 [Legionella sp.]|jgi:hypothetical protein
MNAIKKTLILGLLLVSFGAKALDNKFILEKCVKKNTLDYVYCQGWHEGISSQIIVSLVTPYVSKHKQPPKWFVKLNENEHIDNDFFIRVHRNYLKKNPKHINGFPQTSFMLAFYELIQKYK